MTDLEQIWKDAKARGHQVRSTGGNGLDEWQPLKKLYSKIDDKIHGNMSKFVTMPDTIHVQYFFSNDDVEHTDVKIEKDHFFVQLFRIPILCNHVLPIVKVAQLAYNVGQFEAARLEGVYDDRLLCFFDTHELSYLRGHVVHVVD